MKRKLWVLALVGAMLLSVCPVLADGDFYVIASGGGVGTKITSLPYTVTAPGFYYLSGNLTPTSGNGITVNTDDVTIDLMGFCLTGISVGSGIEMVGRKNVEIRNGVLRNWWTGIHAPDSVTSGHRAINIRAEANHSSGIAMAGDGHLIKGCTALDNTQYGIYLTGAGTISNNVVTNNTFGIYCTRGSVIGNTVTCNSGQTGFFLSDLTSNPILMDQNTVSGAGTHYSGGSSATIWAGKNTDNPWGSNAGHP